MSYELDAETREGFTLRTWIDGNPDSPREWDNAGALFISSNQWGADVDELEGKGVRTYLYRTDTGYVLEDPQGYDDGMSITDPGAFDGWDDLETAILVANPGAVVLPVYKYEHSGVAYRTTPFSCPWDSGQVGFIVATAETIEKEWTAYGNPDPQEAALECLRCEVETYGQWANGEVYGFTIEHDGEVIESCGGFYGLGHFEAEAEAEFSAAIEGHRKQQLELAENRLNSLPEPFLPVLGGFGP